jgi:hypothetical protein
METILTKNEEKKNNKVCIIINYEKNKKTKKKRKIRIEFDYDVVLL